MSATSHWREVQTPWGIVRVRGELHQRHRDVLDFTLACADLLVGDRCWKIRFDPADVLQLLGNQGDTVWLKKMFEDLKEGDAEIVRPGGRVTFSGVIKELTYSTKSLLKRRSDQFGFGQPMWVVELSEAITTLYKTDEGVFLARVADRLAALKTGPGKALARWCLSHSTDQVHRLVGKNDGGKEVGILHAIGIDATSSQRTSEARKALRQDEKALAALGITVEHNCVRSKRLAEVHFRTPTALVASPAPPAAAPAPSVAPPPPSAASPAPSAASKSSSRAIKGESWPPP